MGETGKTMGSEGLAYSSTLERARHQLQDRVKASPSDVEGWFNLGILSRDSGRWDDAEHHFQNVIALDPSRSDACVELGLVRRSVEDLEGAIAWYRRALDLDPQSVSARFNLANCARDREDFDAAIADYGLVLRMEPEHHGAWINLGYAYEQQVRYAEAMQCYRHALTLRPEVAGTYINIGNLLNAVNERDGAIAAYRAALQLDPGSAEAHHSLGLALLAKGEFLHGWEEYEWRLRCHDTGGRIGVRMFSQPVWAGEELNGKTLLVYSEQGLGDNIQFARFLPRLKERGAKVIFACYPALMKLFERFDGVDTLVDLNREEEYPAFDVYTALLSVPYILSIESGTFSPVAPYLLPDPRRVSRWTELKNEGRLAVGLVWATNTQNLHARLRSLTLRDLAPILAMPDIDFYSLQLESGPRASESPELRRNLHTLGSAIETLVESAAIIANLDLVISVDTVIAHLAGAMGKPVWTLLPFAADWRWMHDRSDTPWYPTMRLFRQHSAGRWEEPIREIRDALSLPSPSNKERWDYGHGPTS